MATSATVQCHRGLEGNELAHFRHVDAVAIGVTDLRSGGADDDLFRIGAGEDFENRFFQRGAAHNGVIDDDEVVVLLHHAVGDIVDVGNELLATFFLGDEGAHLDVLVGNLFATGPVFQDEGIDLLGSERAISKA